MFAETVELFEKARREIDEAKKLIASAEALIEKAQEKKQTVTGRPFMKGMNEPEEWQKVWLWMPGHEVMWTNFTRKSTMANHTEALLGRLSRGELYPTEADCVMGEKRKETKARYEAMGRTYKSGEDNFRAVTYQGTTYNPYRLDRIITASKDDFWGEGTYFDTEADCKDAIAAINAEYGDGAFEWACFGIGEVPT